MGLIQAPIPYDGGTIHDWFNKNPEDLYWISAKDGFWVHRPMVIGQVILKHTPDHLPKWPENRAVIKYTFPQLPKEIMAQAYQFFRRIFAKYKTEAEVLIVYNDETKALRLFIPPQDCGHGGVHSAFNPEHLARGWMLIGSMHSHCDFGAGHSGTDTNDASEFDGIHITIGHVNTDNPSWAAMVMVNKARVDYKIDDIADVSDLNADKAPEWWDRYVLQKEDAGSKIAETWKAFRPAPRPQRIYGYSPKWSSQPRIVQNNDWDIDYANPSPDHPMIGAEGCDCTDWDNHVQLRWPGATRKPQSHSTHAATSRPRNGSEGPYGFWPDSRIITPPTLFKPTTTAAKRKASKKARQHDSHEWRALDLINEFHGMLDELATMGIYPSDLTDAQELVRPEMVPDFLEELGIILDEPLPETTKDDVIEGQTTLSDFLTGAIHQDLLPTP